MATEEAKLFIDFKNLEADDLVNEKFLTSVFNDTEARKKRALFMIRRRAKELFEADDLKAFYEYLDELKREKKENDNQLGLALDKNGNAENVIENYVKIMLNDDFLQGRIRYNKLKEFPEWHDQESGAFVRWSDYCDSVIKQYIEKKYKIHNQKKYEDAARIVFKKTSYHPVKDIIESVEWDGKDRIETFFPRWLNTERTAYNKELSRLFFAGGINRLYHRGCKFDYMVSITGKQGAGKSSFIRFLAIKDEFYGEITQIEGDKSVENLTGIWIGELGEMSALKKKENELIKAYISRQVDKYRVPYDRYSKELPRQCVLCATGNNNIFITDETGGRRFFPIISKTTGTFIYEHETEIRQEVLQCWAEAKAKLDTEFMQTFPKPALMNVIEAQQKKATIEDCESDAILDYISFREKTCIAEIYQNALLAPMGMKPPRYISNKIAIVLDQTGEWFRAVKPERYNDFGLVKVWYHCPDGKYEAMRMTDQGLELILKE